MKAAIVGYGSLGRQVANLMELAPGDFVVFDDIAFAGPQAEPHDGPAARPFADYRSGEFGDLDFYVCLGYKHLAKKLEILDELKARGRRTPAFVHPSCFVSRLAEIASGSILYPMCNIDQNVRLERGVMLHNSVVVSHDSSVGAGTYISPGVVLCGNTSVGPESFIGARSVISNGVTLGRRVSVGIGTVVTRDLADGVSAIGSPMRLLSKQLRLS